MSEKDISIIIATYNAEKTLNHCLTSITSQMTEQTELIIIDGGSKDATLSIIKKYRTYIGYTISEKDNGIYDAWNKGIQAAHGRWLMFIGADDILLPNALQTYLHLINITKDIEKYDYICGKDEYVDKKGKLLKILGEKPTWNKMRRYMAAAHVGSLHNKQNLFGTIGSYDLSFKICADYELLLRKKAHLKSFFLDTRIARMQSGGISFSIAAIKECKNIRALHQSIPPIINILLFWRDILAYELFKLKS